MSEIVIFVSSTSIITLDHVKKLKNNTFSLKTLDTLTMRSTWLAQRAWKARKSTTSSLRRSFKIHNTCMVLLRCFPDFPVFPVLPDFAEFSECRCHPAGGKSTLRAQLIPVPAHLRTGFPR